MQRIVCPDAKLWKMVERLISDDVERLGNVQWWSLVSLCTSDQSVKTVQHEAKMLRGVCVGHHERSIAAIFLTPDSVKRGTKIARMLEHEGWDRVFSATCVGVPWQLRPDQRSLVRAVVPEAEADQGVAPVIVMLAVRKTDWKRYVTKRDVVKCGYTNECQACTQFASGMHNAKVHHDDRCRDRIGELMAEGDDQRVSSRTVSEVEIPCPRAGEVMDVGEPSVQPQSARKTSHSQFHSQFHNKFPQFEWVDHRLQESELDHIREQVKRTQMMTVK